MNDAFPDELDALRRKVQGLAELVDAEALARRTEIDAALPKHRASARNLAHYLGLRQHDVTALQLDLAARGLSSLGRCEGHVRDTVGWLLKWLSGQPIVSPPPCEHPGAAEAEQLLHANSRALFGPRPPDRHVYIMVTAPEAAVATEEWAEGMISAGANLLRINGAHESPPEWARVVEVFRACAARAQVPARVVVDLPGPKLRVDILQREPGLLHMRRRKAPQGQTLAPALLKLVATARAEGELPVPPAWLPRLRSGDVLVLAQPDGRLRRLTVTVDAAGEAHAECSRSVYAIAGAPIVWRRRTHRLGAGSVGPLPEVARRVLLSVGQVFLVNASGESDDPGETALALAAPELLAAVEVGERVIVDDGRIVAVVEARHPDGIRCQVTALVKPEVRLRTGKGIAFPDSRLTVTALGEEDEMALAFALEQADAVGVSFVNGVADVERVGERVRAADKAGFGMILKLETHAALEHLPAILFAALRYDPVGLMIARGDLAVDVGFERLAEMQEELLWFGEACHLPVVWATQVLESVTHTGLPTRAEVTDAAMSMRAECVMLNKGPYMAVANRLLADIIRRMEGHQFKKRALYRRLSLAGAERAVVSP
jgi:pyruvate kinase